MLSDVFYLKFDSLELQAERLIDPGLRTSPVAIISSPSESGTIISLSLEAEEEGLCCGMKMSTVRKKKHRVQFLPYNHSLYSKVNQYVYNTLSCFTPVIEPNGMDGFYMDMTGIPKPNNSTKNLGLDILEKIENSTSLLSVLGISINKLISKIITDVIPEKIHKVSSGYENHFLAPLHVSVLPTARDKHIKQILSFLIANTVSHIQKISHDPEIFNILFGLQAVQLCNEANGKDTSTIKKFISRDHITEQAILPIETNDRNILYAISQALSEKIGFYLRQRRQIAEKLKLEIHYIDGHSSSGIGRVLSYDDHSIKKECRRLLDRINNRRVAVRSILLDVTRFKSYLEQKKIFSENNSRDLALSRTIEMIRSKYGRESIKTANIFHALNIS